MSRELPRRSAVVVIGGGVMGVSIAFHLAEAGVRDVVLLERDELGSGSTCKAAGGVRAQFSDELNIALGARSLEAFARFGERPGQEIDLRRVGYLWLLDNAADVAAFEASVALQNSMGVPSRLIEPAQAQRLSPLVDPSGILAAAFSPTDGYCTPESVVLGYATAARRRGVQIHTHTEVVGIEQREHAISSVVLRDGRRLETETVICASGAWSRDVGAWVGVDLPVTPLRRQITFTGPAPGLASDFPMTIDYTTTMYFHREGPGLLLGMSDPTEQPGFRLDRSDGWLPALGEAVAARAPGILELGLHGGWAGLYEITPDHNALIGEATSVHRFLYATGFSGHGFLMGPAVGEVIRDLYLGVEPFVDVSPLATDRFAAAGFRPEANLV